MNRTRANERKMVQLYYLVSSCVTSMFKFIFINQSMVVWSGDLSTLEFLLLTSASREYKSCTVLLVFKAHWWDHT